MILSDYEIGITIINAILIIIAAVISGVFRFSISILTGMPYDPVFEFGMVCSGFLLFLFAMIAKRYLPEDELGG